MSMLRNKKIKYLCLLLGLCIFMTGGCNFSGREPENIPVDAKEEKRTTEIIVSGKKEDLNEDEKAEDKKEKDKKDEDKKDDAKKESEKKPTNQTKPFWQSETSAHVKSLTAVAAAAQQDYKINGARRGWMTKNGKLYGYYDGGYVTPSVLVRDGYLESGLSTEGFEVLLINGSDLAEMDGANVPSDSLDFGVFAAVKQSGKYLLASPSGKAGQISEENYNRLLARYSQSHGTIGRLASTSSEYDRILNYICLYEGRFEDYFVREIRKDSEHAVVIFSPASNTAAVKEYILRNDNGFWEVVYPNLQTEAYPVTAVNRLVPNLNVDLLPKYNLASWRSYIKQEQGGAVAAMFSNHFISSVSEIWYQCATGSCAYFRLKDGTRYAAHLAGDYWQVQQVASDNAAKNYFIEKTGTDCSFIILDD